MTIPSFLVWHCSGCDAPAEGNKKPCKCATNVGFRKGPNGQLEHTTWDDPPSEQGATITALREENARLIVACDALFHSYAVPLEKSDNDKALVRFADAVRPIVYADGKATPMRARVALGEG